MESLFYYNIIQLQYTRATILNYLILIVIIIFFLKSLNRYELLSVNQ